MFNSTGDIFLVDHMRGMVRNKGVSDFSQKPQGSLKENLIFEEVAAIGIPDPYLIETACAFVVLEKRETADQREKIKKIEKNHLSCYWEHRVHPEYPSNLFIFKDVTS
jgi:hypothetical protein